MVDRQEIVTDTESRQGSRTKLNLRVLLVSLFMIAVIFTGFYIAFYAASPDQSPGPAAEQASPAQPVQPPPAP